MTWGQLAEVATRQPPRLSRRGRPTQPAARAAFTGTEDLGSTVVSTRAEAERVPALHRGIDLVAPTIGSFPLGLYRGETRLPSTFLEQPEVNFPATFTITQTVRDLIYDGVAYWLVTGRDSDGFPSRVQRAAPWEVGPIGDAGEIMVGGQPRRTRDLIVFLGPDTDYSLTNGLTSRGLLAAAARTIATATRLEEAAARYAWNEVPYMALTTEEGEELDDEDIEALLTSWEQARRNRATAYLPWSVKAQPVTGPNPEQLQLTEARQYIAAEVARHMNLPPRYVGASAGDSMTYASQNEDRKDLIDLSLRSWMSPIESVLSMPHVTPRGQSVRFDTDRFITREAPNGPTDSGVPDEPDAGGWRRPEDTAAARGGGAVRGGVGPGDGRQPVPVQRPADQRAGGFGGGAEPRRRLPYRVRLGSLVERRGDSGRG